MRFLIVSLAVAIGLNSTASTACEYDPFLFQLPGESIESVEARSDQIMADNSIIRRVSAETYAFEKATRVYLAQKVSNSNDPKTGDRLTIIHPVHPLRGELPKENQTLRIEAGSGGMCGMVGDGDTAHLKNGAYLVVFEGLPLNDYRRRGIQSFDVNDIRTIELLDALRAFGKDLE